MIMGKNRKSEGVGLERKRYHEAAFILIPWITGTVTRRIMCNEEVCFLEAIVLILIMFQER